MKQQEWNEGLNRLDPELVEAYVKQKEQLEKANKKTRGIRLRLIAIAACLALIISTVILVPMLRRDDSAVIPPISDTTTSSVPPIDPPVLPPRAPSSAPQYYGNMLSVSGSSSSNQSLIYKRGISVTARFAEALPDTYTFFDDWRQREFCILRIEVIAVLEGAEVPNELWFIVPVDYMTDYSLFDTFVFKDIAQYSYEFLVVHNQTQGCAEQLNAPLFGYDITQFNDLGTNVMAFDSLGRFDMRLWESTEKWKAVSREYTEFYGTEHYLNYTLQDAEEEARRSGGDCYVHSLSDAKGEAADALNDIKSFENGIYVSSIHGQLLFYGPEIQLAFQKYINGFATNEGGMIYADSVDWSKARFTAEDEAHLPDLQAAFNSVIALFEAGEITPPHFKHESSDKLESSAVFGWYAKTANGVIGVVRVSWCYKDTASDYYSDHRFFDDAYYIIEYGSDACTPIERDALLDRIGEYDTTFIFLGEYNDYGKVRKNDIIMV